MGIRLTGFSTPVIGAEWEYTDKKKTVEETTPSLKIESCHKIKVFISSRHGDNGKYDRVRSQLKKTIEETGLAYVYTFEQEAASTLTVRNHFSWVLEDSDLCIFLIDNADGVSPGVQKEIDIVKRNNKKALYYFCDETSQEKTAIEQSLVNSLYAKSKTVHRFEDLSQNGAQALIDDISYIYHHYCQGRLLPKEDEEENRTRDLNLNNISEQRIITVPKSVVKNIDKCKDYIHNLVFGYSRGYLLDKNTKVKTSELDEWGNQFLEVLFGDKTIKSFNTGMFLETLPDKFFLEDTVNKSLRNTIVREMVSNTLMHREFTSSYTAKFVIEKDRMYVENANRATKEGFITVDNLEPNPKNPLIASFFRNIGYADQLGSGVRKLFKYSKYYSGKDPLFVEDDVFRIIVPLDDAYSFDYGIEAGSSKVIESNNADKMPINADKMPINAGKTLVNSLSAQQNSIIQFAKETGSIKSRQVEELLGVKQRRARRILGELVNMGILERQGAYKSTVYVLKN